MAEWQLDQMKKARAGRGFGDYSYEFAGITTQHALLTMTVPDAAARWLAAQDRRTQIREVWRRQGCSLASLPPMFGTEKHTVLGIAIPDDSIAYVVHKDDLFRGSPADLMGSERVLVVHRSGGAWRIMPRRDLLREPNVSFGFGGCPKQ